MGRLGCSPSPSRLFTLPEPAPPVGTRVLCLPWELSASAMHIATCVNDVPMVFIELAPFTRRLQDLLSDEAYRGLQAHLIEHPEAGAVIAGTGGFRKVRWAEVGRGKSGGARVIYYFRSASDRIYLAVIYGKNEKANLTKAERAALQKI